MTDDAQNADRLAEIARLLGRPVFDFWISERSGEQAAELLDLWSQFSTDAERDTVLDFLRQRIGETGSGSR